MSAVNDDPLQGVRDLRGGLPGGRHRRARGFTDAQILAELEGLFAT